MATRREFLKKAAYVAPAVVTLSAKPAFAGNGSERYPQEATFKVNGPGKSRNNDDPAW